MLRSIKLAPFQKILPLAFRKRVELCIKLGGKVISNGCLLFDTGAVQKQANEEFAAYYLVTL